MSYPPPPPRKRPGLILPPREPEPPKKSLGKRILGKIGDYFWSILGPRSIGR